MRAAKSGIIFVFFALAMLCTGTSRAQAQTFQFQVCNQSNMSASIAISNLVAPGDTRFEVQGWWIVTAGNCETIGTYPQGYFYYFAEQTGNPQTVWSGSAAQLCVQNPGPFDRINLAGYTCQPNEVLEGFTSEQIPATTSTFTWTLQ